MNTLLEIKDVTKYFGSGDAVSHALNGVSFAMEQGEFIAVMGASGSGKSTLLNVIATIERPSTGSILLEGRDISELCEDDLAAFRRDRLGFIFQEYNLLDTLTVAENIVLPLNLRKCPSAETEKHPLRWYALSAVTLAGFVACMIITYQKLMAAFHDQDGVELLLWLVIDLLMVFLTHFDLSKTLTGVLLRSKGLKSRGTNTVVLRGLSGKMTMNSVMIGAFFLMPFAAPFFMTIPIGVIFGKVYEFWNLTGLGNQEAMETALLIALMIAGIYALYFCLTYRIARSHIICRGGKKQEGFL